MKIIPLLSAAAALGLGAQALAASAQVKVADAWCRPAPAGAPSAGCYLTLTAAKADSLVSVTSPAAERVEIHRMDMVSSVMRMQKLASLPLPAGRPTALQPGGLHLMLIRPSGALVAGGSVPIALRFSKAPAVTIAAPVRNSAAEAPAHAHHH